jgi:DNA-binding MarR family transcriptional regulator
MATKIERLDALLKVLQTIERDIGAPLLVALVSIAREPGLSISELADRIGAPQQTASRYAAILQGRYQQPPGSAEDFAAHPLIAFEVSNDDPRSRALYLTTKGKSLIDKVIEGILTVGRT